MTPEETFARWKREAQRRELAILQAHGNEERALRDMSKTGTRYETAYNRRALKGQCLCGECRAKREG